PATGSASTAGNGLRTIISRLLSPTKQAAELLSWMGHSMDDHGWSSLTAVQRLDVLSSEFGKLDKAQQAFITSQLASRWQINRFSTLMRDMANENGYYQKALEATSDATRNAEVTLKELNTVLESNPARLKQMWTMLQNGLAQAIQPLIPWVIYLASEVAKMVQRFQGLDPILQKTLIFGAAFLALVGPVARLIGATGVFFGTLGKAIAFVLPMFTRFFGGIGKLFVGLVAIVAKSIGAIGTAIGAIVGFIPKIIPGIVKGAGMIGSALTGPIGLAIGAALILLVMFREQIGAFFSSVVNSFRNGSNAISQSLSHIVTFFHTVVTGVQSAFNRLPQGVQGALKAVVDMVRRAALAVYGWFSYLNPFQRHSPSLVESVTWGMQIVAKQYRSIEGVRGIFQRAAKDLIEFKRIMANLGVDEWSDERESLKLVSPESLKDFNRLVKDLKVLNQLLIAQGNAVNKQQRVVDRWAARL